MRKIHTIPLAAPHTGEAELAALARVLASGRLSLGEERTAFERELAHWTGARYAVALSSGTAALHVLVRACGIGVGDEVITTPFSFVASTNCFLYEGARPVFVDIDPHTLTLDAMQVEAAITPRSKAVLGVDIFGYPADWQTLGELAQTFNLQLIEDAAQALGAEYRGRRLGSLSHPSVFSFYPNKQLTTAEGGAILTADEHLYRRLQSLGNQGRGPDLQIMEPETLGYSYRMSELHAALGRVQLGRLEQFLFARRRIASWYRKRLQACENITLLQADDEQHTRSWFVYTIRLDARYDREQVISRLARAGIASKAYLPSIHLLPHLQEFGFQPGDFPVSEAVSASCLALPFYVDMDEDTVQRVCDSLLSILAAPGL